MLYDSSVHSAEPLVERVNERVVARTLITFSCLLLYFASVWPLCLAIIKEKTVSTTGDLLHFPQATFLRFLGPIERLLLTGLVFVGFLCLGLMWPLRVLIHKLEATHCRTPLGHRIPLKPQPLLPLYGVQLRNRCAVGTAAVNVRRIHHSSRSPLIASEMRRDYYFCRDLPRPCLHVLSTPRLVLRASRTVHREGTPWAALCTLVSVPLLSTCCVALVPCSLLHAVGTILPKPLLPETVLVAHISFLPWGEGGPDRED